MGTRWADSADKHGIHRADALAAMRNPALWLADWDAPRIPGGSRPDLFIGPVGGRLGVDLLEVMAEVDRVGRDVFVFHVMIARRSTVERARAVLNERKRL